MESKILITDGRSLASLAAIRSLGKRGATIHCGESFKQNLSSYSKHVEDKITYPDPEESPEKFVEYLLGVCREENYDLVIPIRDDTTILLSKYQERFSKVTSLFIADFAVLSKLMDKGETIKTAQQAGVPTPETWFPEESPRDQIREEVEYPILIRPRRSSGSRGIKHVTGPGEFDDAFEFVSKEYGTPIVQEYIEKSGYTTACILFDRNQNTIGEFSYERVKEYPLSGGPTVVGVSTDDQEAKQHAKELLKEAGWMGPAEVEFILDQDGTPKLLEVNPRFWMPIQLAISSGVDFPGLIADLNQQKDRNPVTTYETGITYRWVLPNEILWLMNCENRLVGLKEFISFDPNSECYGSLSIQDPKPVLGIIAQSARFLKDPEKRRFIFNRGW